MQRGEGAGGWGYRCSEGRKMAVRMDRTGIVNGLDENRALLYPNIECKINKKVYTKEKFNLHIYFRVRIRVRVVRSISK